MNMQAYALNAYKQNKAVEAAPIELVIMLYDGGIDFLDKAATAMTMKQIQIKVRCIDKALAILEELLLSLDIEVGGEMAIQLQDLYYYMMREITLANLGNDPEKLRHVASLLRELRESWIVIKGTA